MQPPLVVVVVMLWMSEKRFRVSGGWPMQLLAPFLFVATNYVFVVGFMTTDFTSCVIQYCAVLVVGAFVCWRESSFPAWCDNQRRSRQRRSRHTRTEIRRDHNTRNEFPMGFLPVF
jgi:hypothetical protein